MSTHPPPAARTGPSDAPAGAGQPLTRRGIPTDPVLRVLALATLVSRAGAGAVTTTFAIYFTRVVGLSAAAVGFALSAAAVAALLVQVPAGHLADRRGPKGVLRSALVGAALCALGMLVAHSLAALLLVLVSTTAFEAAANSVRNGYIARVAVGGQGVAFKAYLRAVTNVAMAFGAALGGIALWADQRWAYLAVFALDALATLATTLVLGGLPELAPSPPRQAGQPRIAVLRDTPYLVVTALLGVFTMHFVIMEVGIPLWITTHTRAPAYLTAVVITLNTVVVALFQVRLSRGSDTVMRSARAMVAGAAWIAGGFTIIAFSDGDGPLLAAILLVGGAAVHVVGEMISSGGQWGVQMGLAPMERQGQYQGFAGTAFSLAHILAPTLIAILCVQWGRPGWLVLAALMLGSAGAIVPVSRWALATRERYDAASATG